MTSSSPTKRKKNLNQNHQRQQSLSSTLPRSYQKISDDDDQNDDDQNSIKSHRPRPTKFEPAKSGPVKRIRRSNSSELSHNKRRVNVSNNNNDDDDDEDFYNNNNSSLASIKTGRIQRRPRRLSVDQAIIDRKSLAKSGVRSIILIEFDKKTPLIENFLEQISSNPGSLSQSLPKRKGRSKRATQSDVIISR